MESDLKLADKIAELTYKQFDELPKKGKPQKDKEWTLLSSIVMSLDSGENEVFEVISLGTGSKCLGQSKLSRVGDVINDSHAEIIARRGFLRFLYKELELAYTNQNSRIFHSPDNHFKSSLKPGVKFHLFSSHTPCGDASIFPKSGINHKLETEFGSICGQKRVKTETDLNKIDNMSQLKKQKLDLSYVSQGQEKYCSSNFLNSNNSVSMTFPDSDAMNNFAKEKVSTAENLGKLEDIYRTGAKCVPGGIQDNHGDKVEYHTVGALRIKPGRGDRTICLSCSDKIARWCVVGIQGALLSHFLSEPIYLQSITIGKCPYSYDAMKRSLDRVCNIEGFIKPDLYQSSLLFHYGRYNNDLILNTSIYPSPSAIIWYREGYSYKHEVSINGKKQGVTSKNSHKPESRCKICCVELMRRFFSLINIIGRDRLPSTLHKISEDEATYLDLKMAAIEYQERVTRLLSTEFNTWIQKSREFLCFKLD